MEYPYPAPPDRAGRDAVSVLHDTDGDGTADRIETFAQELNIPMGVLPYGDGCLCFSIPNLYYLRDTDGDGKCDVRQIVLGPFDTSRDTHGMINALRRGGDGWIYACHGFNNQSHVTGKDGHAVTMHSGHTFRFRPDGSRVEIVGHGQVNPFGMTRDEWGYRYTADCHSKPITQLVHDACYPSFARPHDGLGFLPPMMDHLHGSTAISGLVYFPSHSTVAPLRGQFLSGNVMTSRLNRTALQYRGATAIGREQPDFMTSDDPWFRPVDLQLGPDDTIYVADFYNKIIGHYEVPLDHPQRDRTSGRIWQIRYAKGKPASPSTPALDLATAKTLVLDRAADAHRRVDALRLLADSGTPYDEALKAAAVDNDPRLRVNALRIAAASVETVGIELRETARERLTSGNAHVACAAAELLGRHGDLNDLPRLRSALSEASPEDAVLHQTLRIAIRRQLRGAAAEDPVWDQPVDGPLASIMLGMKRPEAATLILRYLRNHTDVADADVLLGHAASLADAASLDACVELARRLGQGDVRRQYELLQSLARPENAVRSTASRSLRDWALELVNADLDSWRSDRPMVFWHSDDGSPWPRQQRQLRGGGTAQLISSHGRGENTSVESRPASSIVPIRFRFGSAVTTDIPTSRTTERT